MHALVDQLAAAGTRRIGAPLVLVADAAAMTVASAHEHQRPQVPAGHDRVRLLQRRVVAMVETHTNGQPALAGHRLHRIELGGRQRRGLLDEDVPAGPQCGEGERHQCLVGGRDNDDGDAGRLDGGLWRGEGRSAGVLAGERPCASGIEIGAGDELRASQGRCALPANETAPDDRHAGPRQLHERPRSVGSMRRSV